MTEAQQTEETTQAPSLDPAIAAAFEAAQINSMAMLSQVIAELRPGMSEIDIASLAESKASDFGFTSWFEPVSIRIGGPTGIKHKNSASRTASVGDLVEINLCPANAEAFGNTGTTIALGVDDEPRIIEEAREMCRAVCGFASRWKCTGEIYVFADAWANNRRYEMGGGKALGHQCFPPEGMLASGWPKSALMATYLKRNQVEWYNHRRMQGIYTLRPRIEIDGQSAAFQEMIYIDGEVKKIMGRQDLTEVGAI